MKKMNRTIGKAGLVTALAISLTGCVIYEEPPVTHTTYLGPPPVQQPPPPPPLTVVVSPQPVQPAVVVIHTDNDFYEPLSPYGEWVVVGSYGRVWRPVRVEAAWRPYANGYWQRTDAGWYWASDEPWGWATYHYGRWDWTPHYGWIWVPQTQWAPAWVTWRAGAGYIGWAPLPPAARITVSGTVEFGEAAIVPRYVFVEERRMLEPVRPRTVIVNNTTVINRTVNITRINVVNKTVINEGPRAEVIERASGTRVQARAARELRHQEETEFVTRKRGSPSVEDKRIQPPARVEPEPARAVLPRNARPSEKAAEVAPEQRPPESNLNVREAGNRKPDTTPERPESAGPARNETKPEVIPVAAKPEARPTPKPAVLPREARRVEQSSEAAKTTQPSVARPGNRETDSRPNPAATARTGAISRPAPQSEEKPADKQLRSPKDKSPANEQVRARTRNNAEETDDQADKTEKPVTPPAPRSR